MSGIKRFVGRSDFRPVDIKRRIDEIALLLSCEKNYVFLETVWYITFNTDKHVSKQIESLLNSVFNIVFDIDNLFRNENPDIFQQKEKIK